MRGVEVHVCEGVEVHVCEGCGGACVRGVWRCMCQVPCLVVKSCRHHRL